MQATIRTDRAHERDMTDPPAARPRVLVFRSCRPAQFADAVRLVRERHPRAAVVALTHPGHREALFAAGVDDVFEVRGRRLSILGIAPHAILRLRRMHFDEVVIPQMTPDDASHANLHGLGFALAARHTNIVPGSRVLVERSRRQLLGSLALAWLRPLQRPECLLAVMAAAIVWPRRRRGPSAEASRTRVLHIISSLGVGGAQRQLAELVSRTPKDAYDVSVLALGRFDGEISREWLDGANVKVHYLRHWPNLVESVREVRRHCRDGDYDIVHCWLFMANVIGVTGARLAGVPRVIASVRNLSLWKRTWYRQWWYRAADALCTRAADVVTVNATALVDDHARWARCPAGRIVVIPNGLDPSRLLATAGAADLHALASLPPGAPILGTVGRLAAEKNQVAFLETLVRVRKERPDVHGVIIGDGELRRELEDTVARMGLGDAVHFLGERRDARRLLARFTVFLLTSTIEGFPNVLLEAAFLGVPSVASRVGGSADVLSDDRLTYAPGDIEGAASKVMALIAQPARAAEAARETQERARVLFTASRMTARWLALYQGSNKETLS